MMTASPVVLIMTAGLGTRMNSARAKVLHEVAGRPMLAWVVEAARSVVPGLPMGVCGEHGGDPASLATLVAAGIDSTSCSPPRVPVARLAVARALASAPGEP